MMRAVLLSVVILAFVPAGAAAADLTTKPRLEDKPTVRPDIWRPRCAYRPTVC